MNEEKKILQNFSSKVLFFDSSSRASAQTKTLDSIINRIEKKGFQIMNGNSSHLALNISENPIASEIAAIILYTANAHDAAGARTLIKNYPHAHIFCLCNNKQKTGINVKNNGNLSTYILEEMTPGEIYSDIKNKLMNLTSLKYGNILFFDPNEIFNSDIEALLKKGICIDSAKSHEELETKIEFHQAKIDAVVIDADKRADNLIKAAQNVNSQIIAVAPADWLHKNEIQKADYTIIKDKKGFNHTQLQICVEKCVVPRVQIKESATEPNPLKREMSLGYVIYIMGSSLSGKTTRGKNLPYIAKTREYIQFAPKHSTRPLRKTEEQGADIISIDLKEFNELSKNKEFFYEFVYRGHKYGVHQSVIDNLRKGKHTIQINPCFDQLETFKKEIKKEFNNDLVMPIVILTDKGTLEERLEESEETEEEKALRKSNLDEELDLFDKNISAFKYRLFSHNSQDPVDATKRIADVIQWEEAHPNLSYQETHLKYVNRVIHALTGRNIDELPKNNLLININKADIDEYCEKAEITHYNPLIKRKFPLALKYTGVPHHGRISLYIIDNKRLNPMNRRTILNIINYVLDKSDVHPKAISKWSSYHKESIFGLIQAESGEICDGACYALTDENSLYPQDYSPVAVSLGFAKVCNGDLSLRNMNLKEIQELSKRLKPKNITDFEFVRAVRKYNPNNKKLPINYKLS